MNQDPSSVMKVQVSAKNLAEVLNEFTSVLNAKAWVSLFELSCP
jgi:glycine cleavage system regulatory protein